MNKQDQKQRDYQNSILRNLGFMTAEIASLRRASNTLKNWYEEECNGTIQRDETTNEVARYHPDTNKRLYAIRDRETSTENLIKRIINERNQRIQRAEWRTGIEPVAYYLQTDPRDAVLYILESHHAQKDQHPEAYYSRGHCIY